MVIRFLFSAHFIFFVNTIAAAQKNFNYQNFLTNIKNNIVELDFNKAYNPYCAYSPDYDCPIPPKENYLTVAVKAGEKNFAKISGH